MLIKLCLLIIEIVPIISVLVNVKPDTSLTKWIPNSGTCSKEIGKRWEKITVKGVTTWGTFRPTNINEEQNCTLTTGFWKTFPARRVLIKVDTQTTICKGDNLKNNICRNNLTMSVLKDKNLTNTFLIPNAYEEGKDFSFNQDQIYIENMGGYDGLKLEFRTERYGGEVQKVEVSYLICPNATENLLDFVSSPAPSINEPARKINGKCTLNATPKEGSEAAVLTCLYDGTYSVRGNCVCDAGYQKKDKQCKACLNGKYKPEAGNDAVCKNCGKNTKLGTVPKLNCECKDFFHRLIRENDVMDADCYQPPLAPTEFKAINVESEIATLTWKASFQGSAKIGKYYLICENCPEEHDVFPITTDENSVKVTGLGSFAEYTIIISNQNNITNLTGVVYTNKTTFTTKEGEPGIIRNLNAGFNTDTNMMITWDEPFAKGGDEITYVVTYGETEVEQTKRVVIIESGTSTKVYTFKIYAKVVVGGITLSGDSVSRKIEVTGGIALPLALGIAFGGIIFFVLVLVIAFCVWRRKNPAYLQVVRMEDGTVKVPSRFYNNGKIYIDPKSYNHVDDAVNDFAFEIDRNDLKVGDMIGEGEFANVYRGHLFKDGKQRDVAIKKLKSDASKRDRDDFLSEAAILGQFSDPNVIMLEGVILQDEPNAIILEFMAHGALDKYLQENDMQFSTNQLLEMARGIASGMKYLSEMGFVHRDLAARNVLVNEQKVCKVADFGMSLELNVDESVETKGGKIPVRWTAPEAIQFKKFTTASDVWSFGVVLWEIMSYGERPYWDWNNFEVVEQVNSGYRLPPPMSCPRVVHDLMLVCWSKDRSRRPLFSVIRDKIESWMRNAHLLDDLAPVMKLDDNLDYTIMQTINKWLEAIGMGRYAANFIEQGFATPRQILLLTMDDLEILGVGPMDHRKRIHKAIANTRAQVEAQLQRTGSVQSNRRTSSFNSMGSVDIAPKQI